MGAPYAAGLSGKGGQRRAQVPGRIGPAGRQHLLSHCGAAGPAWPTRRRLLSSNPAAFPALPFAPEKFGFQTQTQTQTQHQQALFATNSPGAVVEAEPSGSVRALQD